MKYSKEFYETVLKDFLESQYLYTELPKNLKYQCNNFGHLVDNIDNWNEPGDDAWNEWRLKMLAETRVELATEYRVFSEQLYPKHYTTPGILCGELAEMIADARRILPHKFKVALDDLTYYTHPTIDSETIFVWIVFIDEELLKDKN
jgi:hypothetical protein